MFIHKNLEGKMKKTILVVLVLFCCGSSALADGENYYSTGDIEVGFSGGYHRVHASDGDDSATLDIVTVSADGSYFFNEHFSLGLGTVFSYLPEIDFGGDDVSAFLGGLEANARFHYQINKYFIPYIGAHAAYGLAWGESDGNDETEDFWTYGPQIGFKIPVNDHVYFDTQAKYTIFEADWLDDVDLDTFQVLFGLKIKL
jgi:opacity protein-like surface antigen